MERSRRNLKNVERKYGRVPIDLRLVVRTDAATLHGRTKNLNVGGMAATIAGEMPMGEVVELQFQLPNAAEPMVLRAEVRYRQGFQYGFKFLPLTDDQLQSIRNVVEITPSEH